MSKLGIRFVCGLCSAHTTMVNVSAQGPSTICGQCARAYRRGADDARKAIANRIEEWSRHSIDDVKRICGQILVDVVLKDGGP